jgi:hypothetical protein
MQGFDDSVRFPILVLPAENIKLIQRSPDRYQDILETEPKMSFGVAAIPGVSRIRWRSIPGG